MNSVKKYVAASVLLAMAVIGLSSIAQAAWPKDQPITMIVAYGPGGATDVAARLAAVYIEKYLGQSVVIANRVGAGGEVGFTDIAKAKPDGYTVGFINTPNVLTIPMQRKTRYSLDSFIPVAQLMDDPGAFVVSSKSPIKNLKDLVEYAKANPNKVSYGSSGIGSDDHIAGELFSLASGIKMRHIPFDDAAACRTALLGGHIMLGVINVRDSKEYVDSGELTILGQMSKERTELFPNTPTFQEQGFDVVMASTRGIAMPANTDPAIVKAFADACEKAINDPEFRQKADAANVPLKFLNPAQYLESLQANQKAFQDLWNKTPWVQQKKK